MDGNKSDDSFYDSDEDQQMAAASTQSLYDPALPYTPVRPTGSTQRSQLHSTTLSGRRLSSSASVQNKVVQEIASQVATQLLATQSSSDEPLPLTLAPFPETPRRGKTTNMQNGEESGEGDAFQQPNQSSSGLHFGVASFSSPPSFIRASYYYEEAKEKLKQEPSQPMELDEADTDSTTTAIPFELGMESDKENVRGIVADGDGDGGNGMNEAEAERQDDE